MVFRGGAVGAPSRSCTSIRLASSEMAGKSGDTFRPILYLKN